MGRTNLDDLKNRRLAGLSEAERAEFDEAYDAARLALDVGEQIRDAREAAGLTQRDLAKKMGTRDTKDFDDCGIDLINPFIG